MSQNPYKPEAPAKERCEPTLAPKRSGEATDGDSVQAASSLALQARIRRLAILFVCVLAGGLAIGIVDLLIFWATTP